tara:strand:- start:2837 stop:3931 length:1095 start_codon:yes stop_codon:yes gene_type:complete
MIRKILKRLLNEITNPSFGLTRKTIYYFHALLSKANILKHHKNNKKGVLIWDIRSNPITFDIIYLVYIGYRFFHNKNIKEFDVIIFIPKDYIFKSYTWEEYSRYLSGRDLKKRINNMLIPILIHFNCIKKVRILDNKKKLLNVCNRIVTFPEFYNPFYYYKSGFDSYKTLYKLLKRNIYPNPYISSPRSRYKILSEVSKNSEIKSYITFTLRDYGFAPKRNSSTSQIKLIYDFSKNINKKLILIPDQISKLSNYEIPSDVLIHNGARKSIDKRIALYQFSELNFFVQAGPSDLSHFIKDSKTIILNWGSPSFDGSIKYMEKEYGLYLNDQPYKHLNSYLIWYKNSGIITNKDIMMAYLQFKNNV